MKILLNVYITKYITRLKKKYDGIITINISQTPQLQLIFTFRAGYLTEAVYQNINDYTFQTCLFPIMQVDNPNFYEVKFFNLPLKPNFIWI